MGRTMILLTAAIAAVHLPELQRAREPFSATAVAHNKMEIEF